MTKRKSKRDTLETLLWRTGGMPSSHSALASALTVSVGIAEGLNSNLFVVTFFFALVVMRDAMGVRRSSGIQARALNLLGRTTQEKVGVEFHPVKEINGHTPLEVAVGGLLGVFIALAFAYL